MIDAQVTKEANVHSLTVTDGDDVCAVPRDPELIHEIEQSRDPVTCSIIEALEDRNCR